MQQLGLKKEQIVGKWRLDKKLGAGGQGVVWQVRYVDDSHSPSAALKVLSSLTDKARSRFERELKLLTEQNHAGIVRIRDAGEYKSFPYFVMERATTTLARVVSTDLSGNRLVRESRELLLRFIRQACEGVAHLHHKGVLHRDIKPSNILLMLEPPEPMRAVVSDLGIAAVEVEQGLLTATHETVGTAGFRAPEALQGIHTPRSDVYSFGKTMEAVFNRAPSVDIGPGKCVRDQRLTSSLWDALDEVLAKACAFDPATRYENAGALLEALPDTMLELVYKDTHQARRQRPASISLSTSERVALSDVVAKCPATDDTTNLSQVRHGTRLSEYQFAMAFRRLGDVGFLEMVPAEDDHGNRYTIVSPTPAGIRWAQDHSDEMASAIAEFAPRATEDDDIPF
jgi:eukaryotic-like serine/threonine-protein kinase